MLTHRHPNQFSMISAIVATLILFRGAPPAQAQDAYFSLEGQFQNTTDTQSFLFDLTHNVSSAETLHFNTWSHFGGVNAAGDGVAGGGFDPILGLFDDGGISHGVNDDGYVFDPLNINRDAYLTWLTQAPNPAATGITTDPLPIDSYEVKLTAFGGTFPSPWAVDLVGPASKMTATGLSVSGASSVDSLKFGTTGAGVNSAAVDIAQFDTLNIANALYVGNSGKGTLTSLGLINSGDAVLGYGIGSEGSVTLTASGNWLGSGDVRLGLQGRGTLLIQNGAAGSFQGDAFLAYTSTAQGDVTVRDNGSLLFVGGDLEVGDGGVGTLSIEGGGWVNSSGVGALSRDVIGDDSTSNGIVTVTGSGAGGASRWDTDDLIIGDDGSGTLHVLDGGNVFNQNVLIGQNNTGTVNVDGLGSLWQLGTLAVGSGPNGPGNVNLTSQAQIQSGSVTVGSNAANGDITINGFVPGLGLRATWDVTGSMILGSPGLGRGAVTVENAGRLNVSDSIDVTGSVDAVPSLTVHTNGEVIVANNLNIGQNGSINLQDAGSRVQTGIFTASSSGAFNWTAGTLEITGEIVNIDAVGGHSVLGNSLTVGAGKTLVVSYSDVFAQSLLVGNNATGTLRIENGGSVISGRGTVGGIASSNGAVVVDGGGSSWQLLDLRVGQDAGSSGSLTIHNGGAVSASSIGNIAIAGGSTGTVIVDGTDAISGTPSTLNIGNSLYVGGQISQPGGVGSLTASNGGEVNVSNTLKVWNTGTVNLLGSEINTGSFIVQPGGTFTHDNGTLTVDGGTFDPGVSNYTLDGAAPGDLPVVRLINGASASLAGDVMVGDTRRGRIEILSGSSLVLPDTSSVLDIGNIAGSSGEVIVDGQGASLTTDEGLIVGSRGNGILRIRNGGSVFDPNSPNEPIAISPGSTGLVEVSGTAPNGTPSTYSTHGILEVGVSGVGTLHVSGGGHMIARNSAVIAELGVTSNGSSATVDGGGPLGPSRWDVTGSLYVGGDALSAGGIGTLSVSNGGEVNVSSKLHVWNTGSVGVDPVSRINVGTGVGLPGTLNVLTNGTLSGSGQIHADVHNDGGTVSPGASIGTLTITGDYDQMPAGTLDIELGGTAPSQYDELNPTGSANLAGELVLGIYPPFVPLIGDSFDILTAGFGINGRFDSVLFPAIPSLGLGLIYSSNTVTVFAGLSGDLNFDGFVGIADLNIVLGNWNQNVDAGVWSLGDPSGDGFIGIEDLNAVLGNWNAGTPPQAEASGMIPEPGSFVLFVLSSISLSVRIRGRRRSD